MEPLFHFDCFTFSVSDNIRDFVCGDVNTYSELPSTTIDIYEEENNVLSMGRGLGRKGIVVVPGVW